METIKSPQSWFTTLFLKPLWIVQTLFLTLHWFFATRSSVSKSKIFNFITAIRSTAPPFPTPSLKIGVAGFCWGGRHAFLLAADPPSSRIQRYGSTTKIESLIDCAFTAHPSMLLLPKEIEDVRIPMSVCVGEEDMMMTREQVQDMKVILEKRGANQVVTIKGAKHGFAVRVDEDDQFMKECAEVAERQAFEWFQKWLL
jgi:dienelactone hydrolase